ncbi:hypothetical protein P8452_77377 [Trifolium repens]|nr:hypothetical protein P8452_77377 [Trifolium repens]
MHKGIHKLVQDLPNPHFTSPDHFPQLFTTIYVMCTQKPPHNYSEQLYEKYKETFDEYIKSTVYDEMHRQIMEAILTMINRKRAGEPIDETLVDNALTFYSEIGESTRKNDPKNFAETMIKENATFQTMSTPQIE